MSDGLYINQSKSTNYNCKDGEKNSVVTVYTLSGSMLQVLFRTVPHYLTSPLHRAKSQERSQARTGTINM